MAVVFNLSPQHPSTHGVLRLIVILHGEIIQWITTEIGIIKKECILFFGFSGLLSRSCNIKIDARFSGYEFYLSLDYSIFIAYNGDCFDRYILRFNEMIESCRIIYAIFYVWLSQSCYNQSTASLLGYNQNTTSLLKHKLTLLFIMELLIIEFLIQLSFILSLINEFTLSIESSKGIYTIFIHSFPIIFLNIVCMDYLVINQLNKFCKFINIGDLIELYFVNKKLIIVKI